MQSHLLLGPTCINGYGGGCGFASSFSVIFGEIVPPWTGGGHRNRMINQRRWSPVVASSSAAINGEQNHYAVLGVTRSATSADIKKAYRLLALKYHPDVSKVSQAGEVFQSIRQAYEILSNEATRSQYDEELSFAEDIGRPSKAKWNYRPEYEDGVRIYRWAELRRKMERERYWEHDNMNEEDRFFYSETDEENEEGRTVEERGSFSEVLRSAFISLFLMQTFGSRLSLTFSSMLALFDRKLDSGYKIGYVIAWVLGGRGGILLTLSLSFASWVCGKTSSSIVALVVVAIWVGSNLARYIPLPQGALLTLLYMSIKLQVDLN